jgi:alanine racemase
MAGTFAERLISAVASTHAVIDLDAYASNVQVMKQRLRSEDASLLMAVVKANAYGHGSLMCARTAIEAGADWIGVARIEEALRLRDGGIIAPILVLGVPNTTLVPRAAMQGVTLTIGSKDILDRIRPALDQIPDDMNLDVHLKIDTGMRRYGVLPHEAQDIARDLQEEPKIRYSGLFTHFATADEADQSFLNEQVSRFASVVMELMPEGLAPTLIHLCNSAASIRRPDGLDQFPGFTMMYRPGLALLGMSPSDDIPVPKEFHRVLTLKSRIGRVFRLEAGEGVSYGLTHVARHPVTCGTIPIGYGDGIHRALSNRGWMAVKGRRCPILGRVCMDQTVIDINNVAQPEEGDEVIILGNGRGNTMTPEDAASRVDSINYEVTSSLLPRVPRVYVNFGDVVAVEDLQGLIERP